MSEIKNTRHLTFFQYVLVGATQTAFFRPGNKAVDHRNVLVMLTCLITVLKRRVYSSPLRHNSSMLMVRFKLQNYIC